MAVTVLIKGAGEQASGTAHRLHRCGLRVVLTELPEPTAVRRRVCFSQAIYDGTCRVEGVRARRWDLGRAGGLAAFAWDHLPVFVDPDGALLATLRPDAVVDARLLKRRLAPQLDEARLVIGLGPGLCAGLDVHAVIETQRGHDLGRALLTGEAAPDTGVPGELGGEGVGRVLRAPADGTIAVLRDIGSRVEPGDLLAQVGGAEVRTAIGGVVRGMIQPGIRVTAGQKVGDVDPRGAAEACATISDKARTLSGAVLELIVAALAPGLETRSWTP